MPVHFQPIQLDHRLSGDMGVEDLKPAPNDYLQRWVPPDSNHNPSP
jgi:hypothetical protein